MSQPCKHNHAMMLVEGNINDGFRVRCFDDVEQGRKYLSKHPLFRVIPSHNFQCFPTTEGDYDFRRGVYLERPRKMDRIAEDYPIVINVRSHNKEYHGNDKLIFRTLSGALRQKGYVVSLRPDSYEYFPNIHIAMDHAYNKKVKHHG